MSMWHMYWLLFLIASALFVASTVICVTVSRPSTWRKCERLACVSLGLVLAVNVVFCVAWLLRLAK